MLTTIAQINRYFLEGINKFNSGTVSPEEFDVLYNGSAVDFVLQRARAAERDQRLLDTLRALIPAPLTVINTGGAATEAEVFPLPYVAAPAPGVSHGYLHMLSVAVRLFANGTQTAAPCRTASGWVSTRILRRDARNEIVRNPFRRPSLERPYYYVTGNDMRILAPDGFYANEARIEYIRYPVKVSVQAPQVEPDLPPHVNQEIADYAIRRFLENVESRRWNTNVQERQFNS